MCTHRLCSAWARRKSFGWVSFFGCPLSSIWLYIRRRFQLEIKQKYITIKYITTVIQTAYHLTKNVFSNNNIVCVLLSSLLTWIPHWTGLQPHHCQWERKRVNCQWLQRSHYLGIGKRVPRKCQWLTSGRKVSLSLLSFYIIWLSHFSQYCEMFQVEIEI